jgi:hypothetical protein
MAVSLMRVPAGFEIASNVFEPQAGGCKVFDECLKSHAIKLHLEYIESAIVAMSPADWLGVGLAMIDLYTNAVTSVSTK